MKKIYMSEKVDDMTLLGAWNEFDRNCRINNLTDRTIEIYRNQNRVFRNWAGGDDIFIEDVNEEMIADFTLHLREDHNCNDITVNSYLRGVRAFLYYCMGRGWLEDFKIKIPKAEKKLKETYTEDELALLMKKPDLKTCDYTEYKIWALSNYLLGTGNRLSTALNLQIKDVDFRSSCLKLRHTKNRQQQVIPLSDTLADVLQEYLRYRGGTPDDYVFANHSGGQSDFNTTERQIRNYNRSRGVEKTSAHLYRHTFAKNWILNGGDMFRLQKILGHSDLTVVREYVQMFGNDLSANFERFNPLDQMTPQKRSRIRMR